MTREKRKVGKTKRLIGRLRGKFSTGNYIKWFMWKHRPARIKFGNARLPDRASEII